jgi:hypothetical protein
LIDLLPKAVTGAHFPLVKKSLDADFAQVGRHAFGSVFVL